MLSAQIYGRVSYPSESLESVDSDDQTQREMNRFPVFPSRSRFPVAYEDLAYIGRDYEDELTDIECALVEAGLPFGATSFMIGSRESVIS